MSDKGRSRLEAGLKAGDPRDEVLDAWLAERSPSGASAPPPARADAVRLFDEFLAECRASRVPELHRLAKTMTKRRKESSPTTPPGASNGPIEADEPADQEGSAPTDSGTSTTTDFACCSCAAT